MGSNAQDRRDAGIVRPTPSQPAEGPRELLAAIAANDSDRLRDALAAATPSELLREAAHDLRPQLAALPLDFVDDVPELAALRGVALGRDDHSRGEVIPQLREVIARLLADGKTAWGAATAVRWLEFLAYHKESHVALELGQQLLADTPDLAVAAPEIVALVAGAASQLGDRATADQFWHAAIDQVNDQLNSDAYWRVHIEYAAEYLAPVLGAHRQAQRLLRRGRDHFGARHDGESQDQAHFAAMNLAYSRLVTGDAAGALRGLATDLERYGPESLHRAYLHALRALAAAECGDVDAARASIDGTGRLPDADPTPLLTAIGPARLVLAQRAGNEAEIHATISDMLEVEERSECAVEDLVPWRLYAAAALTSIGAIDHAAWCARTAHDIAAAKPLPYLQLWAQMTMFRYASASERTTLAPELLTRIADSDLAASIARRDPQTFLIVGLLGSQDSAVDPVIQRHLARLGPATYQAARSALPDDPVWSADATARVLAQLGWEGPRDSPSPQPASPAVEVRLLGGFSILRDGMEIASAPEWRGRRRARLLFARLVLADGEWVASTDLERDLWGSADPHRTSQRLAPLVHTIRTVLDAHAAGQQAWSLETGRGQYRMVAGQAGRADVQDLGLYIEAALAGSGSTAVKHITDAIQLYCGDVLDGFGFDPWLVEARECVRARMAEARLHVAAELVNAGDVDAAIAMAKPVLEADPLSAAACQMLMKLYAATGQVRNASDCFHTHRTASNEILGLPPSPELRSTYTRLIS